MPCSLAGLNGILRRWKPLLLRRRFARRRSAKVDDALPTWRLYANGLESKTPAARDRLHCLAVEVDIFWQVRDHDAGHSFLLK
jgi:hypothetical protein